VFEHPKMPHKARAWSGKILPPTRYSPTASMGTSPSRPPDPLTRSGNAEKGITLSDGEVRENARTPTRRSGRLLNRPAVIG
jgi:hypothetical protein